MFLALALLAAQAVRAQEHQHHKTATKQSAAVMNKKGEQPFIIPSSLKEDHKHLHGELEQAYRLGGKTGKAARAAADVLHPHFEKEEAFALPSLGLLPQLAKGKTAESMRPAIALSEKLKKEWPQMLKEHEQIVGALKELSAAAKEEQHPKVVQFTKTLKLHARNEEEVLYPTAILIGEYLRTNLQ